MAQKSIYLGLDGIGDITEIDRSNSVYAGPNQSGPAYSVLTYNSTTGLLTGINHEYMGTSIDDLTYTYDALARVSTFTSIDGTATYGYDHTSQIVSATYTTANGGHQPANISYTWDANGNNAATGNVVSANNEVTNDGTFTYQFDADGNRTVRTRISNSYASDYKTTYSWDYRNRLTDVDFFDNNNVLTKHVHYIYDVYQNLIEEDIDPTGGGSYTTKEQFALDVSPKLPVQVLSLSGTIDASAPDDTLLEFQNGSLTHRFLNAPSPSGADVIAADEAVDSLTVSGAVNWMLVNNQGSPTDTVNSNGVLINHRVFSEFGKEIYNSNPAVFDLQDFSGGIADPNTGLIKFGARWYDPLAAVWISIDPAGFRAGYANFSRYLANTPTNGVDPSGLAGALVAFGDAHWEGGGVWNIENITVSDITSWGEAAGPGGPLGAFFGAAWWLKYTISGTASLHDTVVVSLPGGCVAKIPVNVDIKFSFTIQQLVMTKGEMIGRGVLPWQWKTLIWASSAINAILTIDNWLHMLSTATNITPCTVGLLGILGLAGVDLNGTVTGSFQLPVGSRPPSEPLFGGHGFPDFPLPSLSTAKPPKYIDCGGGIEFMPTW